MLGVAIWLAAGLWVVTDNDLWLFVLCGLFILWTYSIGKNP